MKRTIILIGMTLLCMQLSAQQSMPPYSLADMQLKGPVKKVTAYYEDNVNGMPTTKTVCFNRMGFLETLSYEGEMRGGTTHYIFDESGRLIGEEYSDFYNYRTDYVYDEKGCIVRSTTVTNYVEEDEIVYDTVVYVNGDDCKPMTTISNNGTTNYTYDKDGRLISQTTGSYQVEYTYDAAGNMLSQNINNGEFITYYLYDEQSFIIETWEVNSGVEVTHYYYKKTNEFDKYGNWLRYTTTYSTGEETITNNATRTIEYYSE